MRARIVVIPALLAVVAAPASGTLQPPVVRESAGRAIEQENRRFSTLTNVVRARHDTAKAAVSNVRA